MRTATKIVLSLGIALILFLGRSWAASPISDTDRREQSQNFNKCFATKLIWEFDKLPKSGSVPKYRLPYAGYIYPDRSGGTEKALAKYDQAFHGGDPLAVRFERRDIDVRKETFSGLFGWVASRETAPWAGHCNGWVSAAIRHAEPRRAVVRNGVVFETDDIKALLAELYVYCDNLVLGGLNDDAINPGLMHVILANWVGRRSHALGMDSTLGKEVWNYPLYAYSSAAAKRGRRVEVRTNIGYVSSLETERDRASNKFYCIKFHYTLYLDAEGRIAGGRYHEDSEQIDMLWVPRAPTRGGTPGNESGNPHLSLANLMSIWRDSVPNEIRAEWVNINEVHDGTVATSQDSEPAVPTVR